MIHGTTTNSARTAFFASNSMIVVDQLTRINQRETFRRYDTDDDAHVFEAAVEIINAQEAEIESLRAEIEAMKAFWQP